MTEWSQMIQGEVAKKRVIQCMGSYRYTERFEDPDYCYRLVILHPEIVQLLPRRLMTEKEWRSIGVQQSPGWEHYMVHDPDPKVLFFRRKLEQNNQTNSQPTLPMKDR